MNLKTYVDMACARVMDDALHERCIAAARMGSSTPIDTSRTFVGNAQLYQAGETCNAGVAQASISRAARSAYHDIRRAVDPPNGPRLTTLLVAMGFDRALALLKPALEER